MLDLVYRGPLGALPVVRAMIGSTERLVVVTESDAGAGRWHRPALARQETLFRCRIAAEFIDPGGPAASWGP